MDVKSQTLTCSGAELEVLTLGSGEPLLYLHGGLGPDVPNLDHLKQLAKYYKVIAPRHPGFGHLARNSKYREISDLAYLYLDLIDHLGISDGTLMGASVGGWIALEMMVRKPDAMARLVLSAPVGIKVRGREDRDIADIFAMSEDEFHALAYANPARAKRDIGALNDADLSAYYRAQESLAAFTWQPYMHNPQLKHWLHRVTAPTLLISGDSDRFVFDGYHDAFAQALPQATHQRIADAGHFPHVEQAETFIKIVKETFSGETIAV